MPTLDPTKRFSDRVEDYVKYRPSYPEAAITFLKTELGLRPSHQIADIGSGTGIFSQLLLETGAAVYGIEPNKEMREAAEKALGKNPKFKSINASAENTSLPNQSMDFITAAQAFHWFEPENAKKEFRRILKFNGYVVLVWNERKETGSAFAESYEALVTEFGVDYLEVKRSGTGKRAALANFFEPAGHKLFTCTNQQELDFESLKGRLLSSSWAPKPGHPNYEPMMEGLENLFERSQINGKVKINYETKLYYGRLNELL